MLGTHNNPSTEEVVRLSDVRYFPVSFWLVAGICVFYYLAIFPFIALGKVFFMRKFDMDPKDANFVNSLVFLISAGASPLLGLLVDKVGRNAFWVLVSVITTLGCHALLAFTFLNPYIAMVGMGLSYSMLASALWPMVALVIPEHQLGTAYGMVQAVQNMGLAVVSIITGIIVDKGGYLLLEIFFLGCLCVALIISVLILIIDSNGDGLLNMSSSQREAWEQQRDAQAELEREKLLASGAMDDVSPQDLLQRSDFHIRNRYLSRIGAVLPDHYSYRGRTYRTLR